MKILYLSATDIGWKCLNHILKKLANVVGIFSIPKKFNISYSKEKVTNVNYHSFKDISLKYNIPLYYIYPPINNIEYVDLIKKLRPDIILVVGWYYKVSVIWRKNLSLGAIGIHASLLPKYRGGAPLNWALINGEKKTGVTLFYLDEGIDAGNIIGQAKFSIKDTDDISSLQKKVVVNSKKLLDKYLPLIETKKAPCIKQDESRSTYVPQRKPENGLIDWSKSSRKIRNFIRALTKPYPGAYTYINSKKVIIWNADILGR